MDAAHEAIPVIGADLTKTFRRGGRTVVAVDRACVTAAAGQITAIIGPSGSGKSTLLQILAGLDRPDQGAVHLGDTVVCALSDRRRTRLRRERLGFVFQSFQLMPDLTAAQNIGLPLRFAGHRPDPAEIYEVAEELGIADRLDHLPAELSGGQQQRVAVARALLPRPAVVFADEPTGALDPQAAESLLDTFADAARTRGSTVVVVTHDERVIDRAAAVYRMADGRLTDAEHPAPVW